MPEYRLIKSNNRNYLQAPGGRAEPTNLEKVVAELNIVQGRLERVVLSNGQLRQRLAELGYSEQ